MADEHDKTTLPPPAPSLPRTATDRIEGLIEASRRESHRDAETIREELARLHRRDTSFAAEIESHNQRLQRLEGRLTDVDERVLGAMRTAEASVHEVEQIGKGFERHLQVVAEATEQKRAAASTAHATKIASIETAQRHQADNVAALASDVAALAKNVAAGVRMRLSPTQWVAIVTLVITFFVTVVTVAGEVAKAYIQAQPRSSCSGSP